ncbi:hexokinase-domain-containing protein [Dichomitus squalens]|uniref:Phosphotransferase n=1 Tax=Dichomitus squalens TaxID=114155 RepID=A0A4Q9PE32_9APHY|nr:hexokinase-domain-containing protein [Dichomitus squalens]TBU61304.1 hexokinase-domain-containing protein [Dichomitus squalens]
MSNTSYHYVASPEDGRRVLEQIEQQFRLSQDDLTRITSKFLEDFELGLSEYNHPMAMIPTFVTGVPDGTEIGTFLALDLGGTNLRVCEVELLGNKEFVLRQQKYKVSEQLKTGEASVLFDYLADSVDAFLTDFASAVPSSPTNEQVNPFGSPPLSEEPAVPLGLTFSFPVEQTALNRGRILTWTKGFSAKNAVGNDVVQLLQDAFNRKHLHVRCVALVNDTVGALLSRAYTSGGCILGSIFGTGTNGAYVERVDNIKKLGESEARQKGGFMVINTEWGAFNNTRSVLPSTPYDNKLDRQSINPRLQAFEKCISGMYLGEITRNILLSLVDAAPKPLLFNGRSSDVLDTHYGLDTAVMSEVEEAWESGRVPAVSGKDAEHAQILPNGSTAEVPDWQAVKVVDVEQLSEEDVARLERIRGIVIQRLSLDPENVSLRDAAIVRWASSLVANRAAKLSGCAVAAVLVQTGRAKLGGGFATDEEKIGVGVDGSLIQFYPNFQARLRDSLRDLVGEEVEKKVDIGLAKDGSGVGAALCALQATKQGH